MKIAYDKLSTVIEILPNHISGLVIENAQVLYQMLLDLKGAIEGYDSGIVISKQEKPVSTSKIVDLITDFVNFNLNQKSLVSKIVSELEKLAIGERFYLQTQDLLAYVEKYAWDLTLDFPCELSLEKLNIQNLLKGMGITIVDHYDTLEERLLAYMDLSREFEKKELFIFWNLRCLIPSERLQMMVSTALEREHNILFIDSVAYPKLKEENRLIVDEDLCEI